MKSLKMDFGEEELEFGKAENFHNWKLKHFYKSRNNNSIEYVCEKCKEVITVYIHNEEFVYNMLYTCSMPDIFKHKFFNVYSNSNKITLDTKDGIKNFFECSVKG